MAYSNNILLDLMNGKKVERPPVWVMRQAGRILPGYRKTRSTVSGFKELVKSPDLIAQVTIEPLEVLGVDAAILFSDILVIPEAMGVDYELVEKKGPVFPVPITQPADIETLTSGNDVLPHLDYVFDSIDKTKSAIGGRVPLIGFAGAPWTLFAYMIEGSGSKTFAKARRFMYEYPVATHKLMTKITESLIAYLLEKIQRGCDVVQLFDSWAEMLTIEQYNEYCMPYIQQIFQALEGTPSIFFPKGAWSMIPFLNEIPFDAIGIDWKTPISFVRQHLGSDQIIQGNLDPALLYSSPAHIEKEVLKIIEECNGRHIFNLGHGVYPDTDANHVKCMIEAVKRYRY